MSKLGRSILLPFLALAGGANTITAQSAAIQVQVYDYAALDPGTFRHFLTEFEGIWVQAGLPVQVSACRGTLAISCQSQPGSPHPLVIQLRPRCPKTGKYAHRPALGYSLVNQDGGTDSSVFLDSAKDLGAVADVAWVTVLAYGAAHEMGHLLLGAQAHTPRGIMRAAWDRKDLKAMTQNRCHFTDEQIRQLARRSGGTLIGQAQYGR